MRPRLNMLEVQRNRIREGKVQRCSDGTCKRERQGIRLFRRRLVRQRPKSLCQHPTGQFANV